MTSRIHFKLFALVVLGFFATVGSAIDDLKAGKLKEIDATINAAIDEGSIPGAVLWLESKGQSYHSAYGNRVSYPHREVMTSDTIFDVASLTKVLATAPAILHLYEAGVIDIHDPVAKYLPGFLSGGVSQNPKDETVMPEDRERITILHLLTHQSGLPPSISLMTREFWGHNDGVQRATEIGLIEPPGSRFRYSDVNFILLAEIVRKASGKRIDVYARDNFYAPLGMSDTFFAPKSGLIERIAPTTFLKDYGLIRGEVHDPVCRRMRGVAGHAGLFSTAEDIAKFCRVFLEMGKVDGIQIFDERSIRLATESHVPAELNAPRGLGWDIGSPFSYQRGENFPVGGYGHTGWTGTSIWIDPQSETFVILLANRNHPNESGSIRNLRKRIGTLAAEAVGYWEKAPSMVSEAPLDELDLTSQTAGSGPGQVRNGIDVLEDRKFDLLEGRKIGLVTNHTGISSSRRSTIDLLASAPNIHLKKLFSPEHGIRGTLDTETIEDGKDRKTGLPIYSLYKSENRKPTAGQLSDIDTLVFDIQDIGCRFYTYISTMGLAMEAAHENGKRFVVLDRVNPIGGMVFDGPIREGEGNDFVAYHPIPVQHGMTVGELARMFQVERGLEGLDLQIIPVAGWHPAMYFDQTGLPWLNPSPNIRSLTEAMLYPGIGLLEFTNLSVGRGTTTPFEVVGAPWITEGRLVDRLNTEKLKGVIFVPIRFTPNDSVYENEDCGGVRIIITDRVAMNAIDVGLAIGRAIQADYPETFTLVAKGNVLLRHPETHSKWIRGKSTKSIRSDWEKPLKQFKKRRQKFLIYDR
ncbi:MAG: DUF1343 domain-containing protein [Verrucomicrobiales bacterium]|nr:DUF1343 domain-containing protein [Verrucomicrobiales bacterium]